ncbi:thioesterase II family protein [Micromonospora sp. HUAS LYJ1]|uniref:thioesterase II family protein n=1 Tax=Micromonospora sp. HUAS LYJ1 TaxID=3061626 RepID=UPI0026721286|nr:alpha/beta fold hydrolase [Micromonospora sp. HUAS LYJ1]WKU07129.1 thioesterase domain-containing protein [Micromonospora sp. HUAS LYJ1]
MTENLFRLGDAAADDAAASRLVCFPYAGGSARIFRSWPAVAGRDVSVLSVVLPGRGVRLRDRLEEDIRTLARGIVDDLLRVATDRPFGFFGHSMGGLVAYECVLELVRRGATTPDVLAMASTPAPDVVPVLASDAGGTDSDGQIQARMQALGTDSAEILDHGAAMAMLLPGIRADFRAFDTYRHGQEPPVSVPILAWAGTRDHFVPPAYVAAWAAYTTGTFRMTTVPEGHSYIEEQAWQIVPRVVRVLGKSPQAMENGSPDA